MKSKCRHTQAWAREGFSGAFEVGGTAWVGGNTEIEESRKASGGGEWGFCWADRFPKFLVVLAWAATAKGDETTAEEDRGAEGFVIVKPKGEAEFAVTEANGEEAEDARLANEGVEDAIVGIMVVADEAVGAVVFAVPNVANGEVEEEEKAENPNSVTLGRQHLFNHNHNRVRTFATDAEDPDDMFEPPCYLRCCY
ncbi:hypothetical protein BC936DRAFT_148281 [Jimgerdemannia flammicorona]|uniref:Uncharacterized protein n=1 Tax=Jimgerdemannia flammicorona TaxID=994334 RepID=A0A433D3E2_9FUNG|nr:hypothetical protein BC936DRAFT_148281 [Jimgerdemannia flammicorona]